MLHRCCSDHGTAVLVQEEKHVDGDGSVASQLVKLKSRGQ